MRPRLQIYVNRTRGTTTLKEKEPYPLSRVFHNSLKHRRSGSQCHHRLKPSIRANLTWESSVVIAEENTLLTCALLYHVSSALSTMNPTHIHRLTVLTEHGLRQQRQKSLAVAPGRSSSSLGTTTPKTRSTRMIFLTPDSFILFSSYSLYVVFFSFEKGGSTLQISATVFNSHLFQI